MHRRVLRWDAARQGGRAFSGFRVAWAHAGVTACTKGVVTCGSSAFRGEGAGAGVAMEDHANRRLGTVLHLHSDCMGVLERILCMYTGIWGDKLSATDGSAPLSRAVPRIVIRFRAAGCRLVLTGSQDTRQAGRTCTWGKTCVVRCATPYGARTGRRFARSWPLRWTLMRCCGTTLECGAQRRCPLG